MINNDSHSIAVSQAILLLAQVFLGSVCLSQEKGDMFIGGVDESFHRRHRLLELLQEFLLFLVAPTRTQRIELAMHHRQLVLHLTGETP